MPSTSMIEAADVFSRKRTLLVAVATIAFLAIHLVGRAFHYASLSGGIDWWAINAIALLAILATGGGILSPRQIRILVNDDVARLHRRRAIAAGFWTAMLLSMVLYLWPGFREYGARDVLFLVVTVSLGAALLGFALLEWRAHRDG